MRFFKTRLINIQNIPIHNGCNHRCAFCSSDYYANPFIGIPQDVILKNITSKNVILSGINATGYPGLIDLMKCLKGNIGISHINPADSQALDIVKYINDHKHTIRYSSLAAQSGCDTVLNRMNVGFNTDRITELVNAGPEIDFNIQIIVGFPGETELEFYKTVEFIKHTRHTDIMVFQYVDRYGSVAENMSNKVPADIIQERYKILFDIANNTASETRHPKIPLKYSRQETEKEYSTISKCIIMTQENVNNIINGQEIEHVLLKVPESDKPTLKSFIKAMMILQETYHIKLDEFFHDATILTGDSIRTDFSDCINSMRSVAMKIHNGIN
jgi:tRNA A37 methylthiotransferase MiaB